MLPPLKWEHIFYFDSDRLSIYHRCCVQSQLLILISFFNFLASFSPSSLLHAHRCFSPINNWNEKTMQESPKSPAYRGGKVIRCPVLVLSKLANTTSNRDFSPQQSRFSIWYKNSIYTYYTHLKMMLPTSPLLLLQLLLYEVLNAIEWVWVFDDDSNNIIICTSLRTTDVYISHISPDIIRSVKDYNIYTINYYTKKREWATERLPPLLCGVVPIILSMLIDLMGNPILISILHCWMLKSIEQLHGYNM